MAPGQHARAREHPHASTATRQRRRAQWRDRTAQPSRPGRRNRAARRSAQGMPAAIAGTAVVVAAAVGGLNSVTAQAEPAGGARTTAPMQPQALVVDAQLRQEREAALRAGRERASRERAGRERASRERARLALLDKRRKQALAAREQARRLAQARKQAQAREARKQAAARRARAVAPASSYVLPVRNYRLTAGFGASGGLWSNGHTGLDFSAPSGTPVRAVAPGRVTSAAWAGAYGWQVIVEHSGGTQTWYCHLSSIAVRSGAVQAGEVIGSVGSTGNTTGPHLHLEVRVGGRPVDPAGWLRARGVNP